MLNEKNTKNNGFIWYFVLQGTLFLYNFAALQGKQSVIVLPKESDKQFNNEEMNVENAKSQMRKGMLEYCIMLLLKGEPAYANDIIKQLKNADLIVVEGTLYPLLSRLKKDGLLSYRWQESVQGPPRKYYSLTEDGEAWLAGLDMAWQELTGTVNILKDRLNVDSHFLLTSK